MATAKKNEETNPAESGSVTEKPVVQNETKVGAEQVSTEQKTDTGTPPVVLGEEKGEDAPKEHALDGVISSLEAQIEKGVSKAQLINDLEALKAIREGSL